MNPTKHEIFELIKEYSFKTFTHPDSVAKVYAGLMAIERVMIDWAADERKREHDGNAEGLPENTRDEVGGEDD